MPAIAHERAQRATPYADFEIFCNEYHHYLGMFQSVPSREEMEQMLLTEMAFAARCEQARANEQASGGLWAVGVRAASARFRVPSVVMRTPGLTGLGTWGYLIEITGVRELQCNYAVISGVVFQLHEICMP